MKYKVLVSTCLFLSLTGLALYIFYDMESVTTTFASARVFFKYLVGISIVGGLFLVIDLLIGFRNIPGYFKTGTARNLILIAIFLMVVLLPLVGLILGTESNLPNYENRKLAEKPSIETSSITSFPSDFNAYFNDNFAFRKTWITLSNYLKVNYLKVADLVNVVLGKDDWLFLKRSLEDTITPFTTDQLEEIKRNIENQTKWFADRGIYYLIVIAPNKETVYPEYLPDDVNPAQQVAKIDQLLASFDSNSDVNILDLRDPLLEAKSSGQLYYRTDTHWNSYGAFVSFFEIIKQLSTLFPNMILPSISEYTVQHNAYDYSGDLGKTLLLEDQYTEKAPNVTIEKENYPESSRLRKAIIFRDSFYVALEPYLSAYFEEIVNVTLTDEFDYKTLEDDPPDVVITICVQREISFILSGINNWLLIE